MEENPPQAMKKCSKCRFVGLEHEVNAHEQIEHATASSSMAFRFAAKKPGAKFVIVKTTALGNVPLKTLVVRPGPGPSNRSPLMDVAQVQRAAASLAMEPPAPEPEAQGNGDAAAAERVNWSNDAARILLTTVSENKEQYDKFPSDVVKMAVQALEARGFSFKFDQVYQKLRRFKEAYTSYVQKVNSSGGAPPKKPLFLDELKDIYFQNPSVVPPAVIGSIGNNLVLDGGASENSARGSGAAAEDSKNVTPPSAKKQKKDELVQQRHQDRMEVQNRRTMLIEERQALERERLEERRRANELRLQAREDRQRAIAAREETNRLLQRLVAVAEKKKKTEPRTLVSSVSSSDSDSDDNK